jgi:hypothetical protein
MMANLDIGSLAVSEPPLQEFCPLIKRTGNGELK